MKKQVLFICIGMWSVVFPLSSEDREQLGAKKIVIVGAGIAGLTAGYCLDKKGFDVDVYEARNRVGGRILSVFVNGNVAELGGENITDGGSFDNIRELVQELGLELVSTERSFNRVFHHNNQLFSVNELISKHNFNLETLKDDLSVIKQNSLSMRDVLDQLFKSDDLLKMCVSTSLAGYEGASADQLSSSYVETLYHMILGGTSAAHQNTAHTFIYINGGNSTLPEAIAKRLGDRIHLEMPVVSITKNKEHYILTFNNGSITTADILVLALPCPVYNDIIVDETVIPTGRLQEIRSIHNGNNAKIIVPISGNFSKTTIFLNHYMGIFTFRDTMITLYFTRQSSQFGSEGIVQAYAQAQSLIAAGFEESSLPQKEPVYASDELFVNYTGPVGYSWPNDPYAQGSYSYIAAGQEELFTGLQEDNGFMVKTLFAPIDQQLYFAGEHASTLCDVPGTIEAACQSGNLVAAMIEKSLKS